MERHKKLKLNVYIRTIGGHAIVVKTLGVDVIATAHTKSIFNMADVNV